MSAALRQPEVVRAFFAIELDTSARVAAMAVSERLRPRQPSDALRWVRSENFHVTLRFLGNVEADRIPELMGNVAHELQGRAPFELELRESLPFPQQARPRAVVLGLEPAEAVAQLAEAVEAGVVASGYRRERRAFRSHLTLARVRRGVRSRDLELEGERPEQVSFPVREVVLVRSQLRSSGPEYTALERIALGAPVHPPFEDIEDTEERGNEEEE